MKSVGEVMAIGRNFQESLHKALRGLETGKTGFDPMVDLDAPDSLTRIRHELQDAGCRPDLVHRRCVPRRSLHGRRLQADQD